MIRAGDVILIALCSVLVGAAFAFTWRGGEPASWAVVRVAGQPERRIALTGSREIAVPGRRGESLISVVDGRVRFVDSPCHGKQCIHAGWLDAAGDFAACLPNGVSLTMISEHSRYDAVVY